MAAYVASPSRGFMTASQYEVGKRVVEESVKAESSTKKRKVEGKRSFPPKKPQLVCNSDSEDEDDDIIFRPSSSTRKKPVGAEDSGDYFEIYSSPPKGKAKATSRPSLPSSSSSSSSSRNNSNWDRGMPEEVKMRDKKAMARYGTLNPSLQGTAKIAGPANVDRHALPEASKEPELSPQQADILAKIMRGENFFFTGSAGTGKSVLLRAIILAFKKKRAELKNKPNTGVIPWELAITASTGMAGLNIGGGTLHAWAGVGIAVEPKEVLAQKVQNWVVARQRWERTSALIVDEISMVDGKLFEKLDYIGRTVRRNQKPFGGIQLILSGDFHQLPPVSKRGEPTALYAFESAAWRKAFDANSTACLKQVFRQKDVRFVRMLEEMRKGRMSYEDEALILSLSRKLVFPDGVPATELYPLKAEVDRLNNRKMAAIRGETHHFTSIDIPGVYNNKPTPRDTVTKVLDDSTRFASQLDLKVGAIVMLLQNYTEMGLCNGSTGKIVDMMTIEQASENGILCLTRAHSNYNIFPVVEFVPGKYASVCTPKRVLVPSGEQDVSNSDGTMRAKRVQLPLLLAWGMTVHKAQGSSLERVKVDLQSTFADGQAYVALSRATCLEGLEVANYNSSCLRVSNTVLEWSSSVEGDT